MSGSLTDAQREWIGKVIGQAVTASPGAPAKAGGGSGAATKTGVVKTPFGDFLYLSSTGVAVEAVMSQIVQDYEGLSSGNLTLAEAIVRLESLEETYNGLDADDLASEINGKTDRTLKNEAGAARGAAVVDKGFKIFLEDLLARMQAARTNVQITADDLKVQGMRDQSAAFAQKGKELLQGPGTTIMNTISSVVSKTGHVMELIEKPTLGAWVDVADDLFSLFADSSNEFLEQAAKLETEAAALNLANLAAKAKLAREAFSNAKTGVDKWRPVVSEAGQDVKTKSATRDNNYDAKKGGKFRFGEVKQGAELAKTVHDLALQTAGEGHRLKTLINGLLKVQGDDYAKWMGNPATGGKIVNAFVTATRDIYTNAEPRVGWGAKLEKKFQALYAKAGSAVADAPGTAR